MYFFPVPPKAADTWNKSDYLKTNYKNCKQNILEIEHILNSYAEWK